MTIYFHCGAHKTASQFVREFFCTNQALFNVHSINLHIDKFRGRKKVTAEEIIDLAEQDRQNDFQHTVISEDANIIGLMPGLFTAKKPNFFSHESIAKFCQLISAVHQKYQTKFLLCVRRQDTYIESCYKFRKARGAKYSFESFLDTIQKIDLSWFEVINTVAEHIGQQNCIATPYELLKRSQYEFISTFLRPILTIEPSKVLLPPPKNLGASELAMAVISYFDREFPEIPGKHRKQIISTIEKYQSKNRDKSSLLSDLERKNILRKYAASNRQLFANFTSFIPLDYYHNKLPPASD